MLATGMDKFEPNQLRRAKQFLDRELKGRLVVKHVPATAKFLAGSFPNARAARRAKGWQSVEPGFRWGPPYSEGWYQVSARVPADWAGLPVVLGYENPEAVIENPGAYGGVVPLECTIWREDNIVGALDWAHLTHRVLDRAEGDETISVLAQTYAPNLETTVHGKEKPRTENSAEYRGFHLMVVDAELLQLTYDVMFVLSLAESLPETDPLRAHAVRALNETCNTFDPDRRRTINQCRRLIRDRLEAQVGEVSHTITPVGHAHLDTAWLWPLSVTRLKMAHTTALQLEMMERHPEYVFAHSQASQYEWLEHDHPALFQRIRQMVKKGQWEVVGSMWVEADCNMAGGESLVRQFLYGRRYFREKLGVETHDMWLPDVFGYAASLPQILEGFGIKYFLTQKLSWNQQNKIPHNTFWWQGIDGTKVWTHFPPADTYVADAFPKVILQSVRQHRDHARSDRSLLLFGWGDGGGGPTETHLNMLHRARRMPGLPAVEAKRRAVDFFAAAYEESQDLRTWVGELYLELHRGTYTSQAANKRANRECEFLLRDAELLSAMAPGPYPAEALERLWKLVLLNQFHDIIPGSSVREVYEDSEKDYARVREGAEAIIAEKITALARDFETQSGEDPVAIFHFARVTSEASLPWPADRETPGALVTSEEVLPVQLVEAFDERKLIFATPESSQEGVTLGSFRAEEGAPNLHLRHSARRIENEHWALRFDANGHITSLRSQDNEPLEFIRPGALANVFQLFDDNPLFWSAWDVDAFAFETGRDLLRADSVEIVERGPVRVAYEVVRSFGNSRIRQRISLGPTPGVRFDTEIDWHEENKMLKVAFPLNVHTDHAKCEIQFGHVSRPTHRNTSWDEAKFEVCAQKWVDLSEAGQGVALINTGKYGHDVLGDTVRLSLLRAPKAPDPQCDMGRHRFTYVLLPHYEGLTQSPVVASSYAVNAPVHVVPLPARRGTRTRTGRLITVDDPNLVIESVKRSEDGKALIVRLYECHGARGRAFLSLGQPIRHACLANMEEAAGEALPCDEETVTLDYRPFGILTVRLETAG